jgi:DNA-binding HxlR family transcriptional regulator
MVLLDVLGRRRTLHILWELRGSPLTFGGLRAARDEISPSVRNQRPAELKELDLIEASPDGYQLTNEGRTLGQHLLDLDGWARRWLKAR